MSRFNLGKYRTIVMSIALFLLFDLGVLVLNFTISSQITGDAVNVNLAGRQRMLSQRIAKTALQIEARTAAGTSSAAQVTELKAATDTFDRTLGAFTRGGRTISGSGAEIEIPALDDDKAQAILREANTIWSPLNLAIRALDSEAVGPDQAKAVARTAEAANLGLLKLMNDLTSRVETTASDKATTLRMVQVGGITLATVNFLVILFHFIGHLRRSDAALERAHKETDDILRTTQEGLFLLDPTFKIGRQHSKALPAILGVPKAAELDFTDYLSTRVSKKTLDTAREYLDLLLNHDIKEKLVKSVNPLNCVEISIVDGPGQPIARYLEFSFNRVTEAGRVTHLLVTANDITRRIKLEQELKATEEKARGTLGMLVEVMQVEPTALSQFLRSVTYELELMNTQLRDQDKEGANRSNLVHWLFRQAHRIKGDASALGMKSVADSFHQLEDILGALRERPNLTGEAFLPVTVRVKELFEQTAAIQDAATRLSQMRGVTTIEPSRPVHDPAVSTMPFVRRWEDLAAQICTRRGNRVEVSYRGVNVEELPEALRDAVNSLVNQFIRNAVVHGIESPEVRKSLGKPEAGRLAIYASNREDGGIDLSFRDDGRGISIPRLREAAVASGRASAEDAARWDARRVAQLMFEAGISTSKDIDQDAGRGAGLDVVKELVANLGGHISVGSTPNEYCHFRIRLGARPLVPASHPAAPDHHHDRIEATALAEKEG